MEGGSRGGGDLCTAAQEPRQEAETAARSGGGGAMRARVCACVRTPQGVGAVLLIGGAIVGAAVAAWRRARRSDREGGKNHHREPPVTKEVLDGGVVVDEQGKFDQSDEILSREDTGVGANGLDAKATEEFHQIQENEIVEDETDGQPVEKIDESSIRECTEIVMDDTDSGNMKKADENSSKSSDGNEITPNATEDVKNSDQIILRVSSPEIAHEEHNNHNDGAQEVTSTQTTQTTQIMLHQQQILEQVKMGTMTETAVAEVAERTNMEKNVVEQQEEKAQAEVVELVGSPVNSSLPSLLKPTEKKGLANPGWNETGMKLNQDCTDGELSKGGATQGVALVTMDRRAASMAILALVFAVIIGITTVVRLYAPSQVT